MRDLGSKLARIPKVPSAAVEEYYGVLDEDLSYDEKEGKPFSIWEINQSGVWADTDEDVPKVLPPFVLQGQMVRHGVRIKIRRRGGKWFVAEFPKHMKGVTITTIPVAGSGTVKVGTGNGSLFSGVKAPDMLVANVPIGANVRISLQDDGLFHLDLAPC